MKKTREEVSNSDVRLARAVGILCSCSCRAISGLAGSWQLTRLAGGGWGLRAARAVCLLLSLAVFRYCPMASRTAGTISLAQRVSASAAGVSSVLR